MKRGWILMIALAVFSACNDTAEVKIETDTLVRKADSIGNRWIDTAKVKLKNVKDDLKKTIDRKDSVN